MPIRYTVKAGDCISSIAYKHGFSPDTIWQHAGNQNLKQKRQDPNVLKPGDVVVIPDKEIKEVSKPTEQRHRFVLRGVPAMLRLQLLDGKHKPRSNLPYRLIVDGKITTGSTDDDGMIVQDIPPDAQKGTLDVKVGSKTEHYELRLGHVNPHDDLSGVQQRLRNLGYPVSGEAGQLDEQTRNALKLFQGRFKLPVTGEADNATLNILKEIHRC